MGEKGWSYRATLYLLTNIFNGVSALWPKSLYVLAYMWNLLSVLWLWHFYAASHVPCAKLRPFVTDVPRFVCPPVDITMSCVKTDEQIEMMFALCTRVGWAKETVHCGRGRIPQGKGQFWEAPLPRSLLSKFFDHLLTFALYRLNLFSYLLTCVCSDLTILANLSCWKHLFVNATGGSSLSEEHLTDAWSSNCCIISGEIDRTGPAAPRSPLAMQFV